MLSAETIAEAQRQFEICNACRYCEGVCPVFPALERRTGFAEADISFLANLCHDCRTCYHVCPFTPPHEYAVDIPQLMSGIRQTTYVRQAWPRALGTLVARPAASLAISVAGTFVIALLAAVANAGAGVFDAQLGAGAFYRVIPWAWMFAPAMILSLWAIYAALVGFVRFWRSSAGPSLGKVGLAEWVRGALGAVGDSLTLRHMTGGGPGCDYPDERPSRARRRFHGLVFWGFAATFASTTAAFIKQEFLGELPPYPWLSEPVILGSVGGVAMIVGALGLLWLKTRSAPPSRPRRMVALDQVFLWVIVSLNVTGMALLLLRETAAMGGLLVFHLALVGAFFMTAPYGKFVHFVYRVSALIQDRLERRRETVGHG